MKYDSTSPVKEYIAEYAEWLHTQSIEQLRGLLVDAAWHGCFDGTSSGSTIPNAKHHFTIHMVKAKEE